MDMDNTKIERKDWKWQGGGNGPTMPDENEIAEVYEHLRKANAHASEAGGPNQILHLHQQGKSPEPFKLKLMKMSKGMQWEISVSGNNFDTIISIAKKIDDDLKLIYPTEA